MSTQVCTCGSALHWQKCPSCKGAKAKTYQVRHYNGLGQVERTTFHRAPCAMCDGQGGHYVCPTPNRVHPARELA